MKNTPFIIAVIIFGLTSCENKAKQQIVQEADSARIDSLKKVQEAEEHARLVFEDSVAIYAWGDVKFGMSKKEVLQTKAFGGSQLFDDSFSMEIDKMFALKRSLGLKNIPQIWIDLGGKTKNEVVSARINVSSEWNNFNDLKNDMRALLNEFTSKYGYPTYLNEDSSTFNYGHLDKLGKYNALKIAEWSIGSGKGINGTKFISMVVLKTANTVYDFRCTITNSDFPKQPKEKTQEEIDKENERIKKSKDALENAF